MLKAKHASIALCAVLLAARGFAQQTFYVGLLNGANENPPSGSAGTGSTTVTYDATAHLLTVDLTFSGLSTGNTAAHIHCCIAAPGIVGVATVTPTFTGFPSGTTSGTYLHTFDLTASGSWNPAFVTAHGGTPAGAEAVLAAGLAAGQAYLNIHSTSSPGGEIRTFLAEEIRSVPAISWLGAGLLAMAMAAAGAVALRTG
jgi:hypothetical protein